MKNRRSKLLERVGLGSGIIGLGVALYSTVNALFIDPPSSYEDFKEINLEMSYLNEAKRNLEKSGNYFCEEDFDKRKEELFYGKKEIENAPEFKEWEDKKHKNGSYFTLGIIAFCWGTTLFMHKFTQRKLFGNEKD
jgi:hypothetical protein